MLYTYCNKKPFYNGEVFIARQHTDKSVSPSVHDVPGLGENGLTYCHSFFIVW